VTPRSCALVALCSLVLSGCVQTPPDRGEPTADRMDPSVFAAAGPWAEEFADAAVSPYQVTILEDGVITADERADARSRTRACMREHGYRYEEHRDGAADVDPLHGQRESIEQVRSYLRDCSRRFDHDISMLFDAIRRNPEHRDEAALQVACLRRAGVVGVDYTEQRWRTEREDDDYSFAEWSPEVTRCRLDPLGLLQEG
jgi:hypothetical protein